MHPAHKLNYFKKLQWEDDWVVAASVMVCDRWTTNYKFNDFGQGVFELSTVSNIIFYVDHHLNGYIDGEFTVDTCFVIIKSFRYLVFG